ncbi:MAG TPA: phosphatidylglycerol lysyltransferase domain-containing protein [Ktedonobacteraceae bacterium]|nr:phosphatidylglycerol lysyltransferase domain-containing protein [Ktedonobacteraceae bacterium]
MLEIQLPTWTQDSAYTKTIRAVVAAAVALMGALNGLAVLLPIRIGRLELLLGVFDQFAPFTPSLWPVAQTGRTVALILGFFLYIVAFGLARGKRHAWQFAVILLPLSALAHMVKGIDVEEAALALVLWFFVLGSKSHFGVESDPWRARQGVLLLLLGVVLLLAYSVGGFYYLRGEMLFSGTIAGNIRNLLERTLNQPAPELLPLTSRASWFLQSIPWLSAVMLLTGMVALLRPVSARWWMIYQGERLAQSRQKVVELVYRYGGQALSFFTLVPGMLRFLDRDKEGVISYRLAGNVAVTLGDPICVPGAFERLTRDFLTFCSNQDWRVAIFQAYPDHLPIYHKVGLRAFKIGEEAIIYPQTFTLAGSAMANVRTSCRRAEREGVALTWYEGVPPEEMMSQLQQTSSKWLERKGGIYATEMGFSLGRFDGLVDAYRCAEEVVPSASSQRDEFVSRVPRLVTGIATGNAGQVCAFVTFTPIYGTQVSQPEHARWGWALDLMRRTPDAPPGIIELLIVRSIERFRDKGAQVVSLGTVAMADTRQELNASQKQLANFAFEHLKFLETHRSLLRFKQKFQPCWESRYIAVSTTLALPKIALALLRVHQS